jgi:pimeloyl-ACP methyl ester carboxylesterase
VRPPKSPYGLSMNGSFLDTHPSSPIQASRLSEWGKSSRSGIRYVETRAACFRVREGGSGGPTIVFFADGPNTLEHHDPIFDKLTQWARVILVDPPGFGFSAPNPNFDFRVDSFADAFAELLTALESGPYVLCPTCTNVYPSVLLAANQPALVSHMVLMQALDWDQERTWTSKIVDPAGDLAKPYTGQELIYKTGPISAKVWYANAVGRAEQTEAFLRQSCECLSHRGNFCLASLIQSWFGPNIDPPSFAPVSQPALAVWGLADRSHRKSDKRSLLKMAPHAQYIEREGVGHFPEIEDPTWFENLLRDFLGQGHPSFPGR